MSKILALLLLAAPCVDAESVAVNPIRRVVTMMQMMTNKIEAEAKKEEEMFDRFMCYCKNGGSSLSTSISDAQTKIPQLEASIKESNSAILGLKADVKQGQQDRDEAKSAMKDATALREKEAQEFNDYDAEATANLKAMTGAIAALEKGMGGSFIQTPAASLLQKVAESADLMDSDREVVTAFLANGYAPQAGQITGILKQMKDTWTSDLDIATKREAKAKTDYEGLMKAKTKEVYALQKMIEEKTERIGKMGVEVVNMADDLDDTQKSLAEDQKFLADMEKNCALKKDEWDERQKVRSQELLALHDTIKLLNDDDSLELFKKTLPTPAFMEVKTTDKSMREQARSALQGVRKHDMRLDLISLALHSKKVSFAKVISMIDAMVKTLGEEQNSDDAKKEQCAKSFDLADDDKKSLARAISDLETTIDDTKSLIATLTEEIAALKKGISDLDKSVADATAERKDAHATFVDEQAQNQAATDLLEMAKNRLNQFYNRKLFKPAPKRVMSREEQIVVGMGGTLAPTAPPGGIAGTGITALQRERPAAAPEMYGGYKNQGGDSVIAMIDVLKADLAKEMEESATQEQDDQKEYETMVSDSKDKRAADSKSLQEKEGAKADAEAALTAATQEHKDKEAEAMANAELIHNLHQSCDWLISNFQVRKEARAAEVQSLTTAKAVLSGSDYSFLQEVRTHSQTCPSTSVQCGMTKDAAGDVVFVPHDLPQPDTCVNVGAQLPKDGQFKICGPGTFSLSRMTCDRHDYKSVTIEQPTDQFTASDCKVYKLADFYQIHGYIGSAKYSCGATAR